MGRLSPESVGKPGRVAAGITTLISFAGLVLSLMMLPEVATGAILRFGLPWVPALGVEFAFSIDGLSLLFLLLICGTGTFVSVYASAYLHGDPRRGRFFGFLLAFELAMLGLVAADDLITLFVFWELTTLTSYLLIGFDHASDTARRNAWQALLVTGAGGLALLAGLLLLADAAGSMRLSAVIRAGDVVRDHQQYAVILALILAGAFTKSAQFPFHFWLPNAMAAPTPVSAYLHSATMVKAGIYLLARLHPALGGTGAWIWTLTLVGAVTAVWASIVAMRQTDLKLTLAYTTVMALGTLTMFLGGDAAVAIAAAMTFLLVHALYKCGLFLVVGIIDHEAGTRDANRLSGLARAMPITAAAAAVSALSMAGFPPFLGFIGKELKYEGALAIASEPVLVAVAAVSANALMVAVAGVVVLRPFFGRLADTPAPPHDPPFRMWIGPVVLSLLGLAFGALPPFAGEWLVQPAVAAVVGSPVTVKLALWHGLNPPLLLSIVTFAIGLVLYAVHQPFRRWLCLVLNRLPITGDRAYDRVVDGVLGLARFQTAVLQCGRLRTYLFIIFLAIAIAVGGTMLARGAVSLPSAGSGLTAYEWVTLLLIAGGALVPAIVADRLAAICGLGVVGAGIAVIFLLYGAPDVAMTQLLVEVLFIVMIAIILLKLPPVPGQGHPDRPGRLRDAAVAACIGVSFTLLMLSVLDTPISRHVTEYFEANSVPLGHGRNIVNVILVDFRAFDTLGEIIVVAVAAIGAYAVIKLRARQEPEA